MAWRLSPWLILVRLFQLLGSFIVGALNGFLINHIRANRLGLADTMVILEILVTVIFACTSVSLFVIHTRRRSKRTAWMACSILLDIVLCFVDVAIVSILAFTGLPSNCSGLTRSTFRRGDNRTPPARGYTTIRFSNEQDGHRGELDRYCGMERGFYSVAIAIILSYIITIILSVLRIRGGLYPYSREDVDNMLEEQANSIRLELKLQDTAGTPARSPATPVPPPPPPRGARTGVEPGEEDNYYYDDDDDDDDDDDNNNNNNNRDLGPSPAPPTPTPRSNMISFSRPIPARPAPAPAPAPAGRTTATGTTLAAGPSAYHHHHNHHHGPDDIPAPVSPVSPISPVSPVSPLSPTAAAAATTPAAATLPPGVVGFGLSPTEVHANLAMVTDGSHYTPQQQVGNGNGNGNGNGSNNSNNQLPPYSPGEHGPPMSGHGDESNEIRLSGYVKGATRAQDMKDEGGY